MAAAAGRGLQSCQAGNEAAAAAAAAVPHWLGDPVSRSQGRIYYEAFEERGQHHKLGDSVYLRPVQPGLPPFVGKLESLHEEDGERWADVRWYYRPTELEVGHEVEVEANELFFSDDFATHPLGAVCGACEVLTPVQADRRPGSNAVRPSGPDVFVCSRKYIPGEGRVVPLDDGLAGINLAAALQEKPFAVVGGKLVQRRPTAADRAAEQPRPKRVRPNSAAGGDAAAHREAAPAGLSSDTQQQQQQQQQQSGRSKRRRHSREAYSPEPFGPGSAGAHGSGGASVAAAAGGGSKPGDEGGLTDGSSAGKPGSSRAATTGSPGGSCHRAPPKQAKPGTGRWAKDRYEAAQHSLAAILRRLGATAADRAILRPALREEACKAVGDTGLLDHLLKHKAGQVVSPEGERLQRRHNSAGRMVYWLQSPAEAEQEEEALREERETLSSEMREVREARRVLHAVRGEAAQAIQAVKAVSGIKERPEEVVRALTAVDQAQAQGPPAALTAGGGTHPSPPLPPTALASPPAVAALVQGMDAGNGLAEARVARASEGEIQGQAAAEPLSELARQQHILQLATIMAGLVDATRGFNARCEALERQVAALSAMGRSSRDEVVASLASIAGLRQELVASQRRIFALEADMAALRAGVAVLAASLHDQPVVRAALELAGAGASTRIEGAANLPGASVGPATWPAATPAPQLGSAPQPAAGNAMTGQDQLLAAPGLPLQQLQLQHVPAGLAAPHGELPGPGAGGGVGGKPEAAAPLASAFGMQELRPWPQASAMSSGGQPPHPFDSASLVPPLHAQQQGHLMQMLAAGAVHAQRQHMAALCVEDQLRAAADMAVAVAARNGQPATSSADQPQVPPAAQPHLPQQLLQAQRQQQPGLPHRNLLALPDPLFAQFLMQQGVSSVGSGPAGLLPASRAPTAENRQPTAQAPISAAGRPPTAQGPASAAQAAPPAASPATSDAGPGNAPGGAAAKQ